MESYLKDQWYQLDEQYRNEEYRKKKQLKTHTIVSFNKLQPILEKKNKDKYVTSKRRESKQITQHLIHRGNYTATHHTTHTT